MLIAVFRNFFLSCFYSIAHIFSFSSFDTGYQCQRRLMIYLYKGVRYGNLKMKRKQVYIICGSKQIRVKISTLFYSMKLIHCIQGRKRVQTKAVGAKKKLIYILVVDVLRIQVPSGYPLMQHPT